MTFQILLITYFNAAINRLTYSYDFKQLSVSEPLQSSGTLFQI